MVKVTPAPIVIGPALIEFLVVLVEKLELIVLLFSYIQPLATVEAKPVRFDPSATGKVAGNLASGIVPDV